MLEFSPIISFFMARRCPGDIDQLIPLGDWREVEGRRQRPAMARLVNGNSHQGVETDDGRFRLLHLLNPDTVLLTPEARRQEEIEEACLTAKRQILEDIFGGHFFDHFGGIPSRVISDELVSDLRVCSTKQGFTRLKLPGEDGRRGALGDWEFPASLPDRRVGRLEVPAFMAVPAPGGVQVTFGHLRQEISERMGVAATQHLWNHTGRHPLQASTYFLLASHG